VATPQLFAGNLVRQPAYARVEHQRIGELPNSDFVMDRVFWIGLYPDPGETEIAYMVEEAVRAVAR